MAEVAAQPVARLVIRHALQVVDVVPLEGDSLSIGRWSQCRIVLPHDAVSRVHARLVRQADAWHITDMGSVNGIRINGESVPGARLAPGDVIEIRARGRKRPFYGCTNYSNEAKCDFRLWQKPIKGACPQCGAEFLVRAGGKKNPVLKCANETCGYDRPDMGEEAVSEDDSQAAEEKAS